MGNIEKLLKDRKIPDINVKKDGSIIDNIKDFEDRQNEIKKILQTWEYGNIPPRPEHMNVEILEVDDRFCAGKAVLKKFRFVFKNGSDEFSFVGKSVIPSKEGKYPAFVHINFRPDVPDKYMLSEEIVDRGFATFSFCYQDVTTDDNDFKNGCAKYLCKNRKSKSAPGKIAIWAWAAMRMMDYVETLPEIDLANVAVVGHSRLGKTALVAGAFDSRFNYVISNCSGCSGAAITRNKIGETVPVITERFPFWFCPKYRDESNNVAEFPFDQHFLLALSVPRHVIVGSAKEDSWADPTSEFLSLASINPCYELYGLRGLVHSDEVPQAKSVLDEGDSCYQIREGLHYFSREDWAVYMDYIDSHMTRI